MKYRRCRARYKGALCGLTRSGLALTSIGSVIGGVGIGLVASVVGSPAGIICSGVGVGLGGVSALLGVGAKTIQKKVEKHTQLYILASAKLASINFILSKALKDGRIDETEFKNLHADINDYKRQTRVIQKTAMVASDGKESSEKNNPIERRDGNYVKKASRSITLKIRWGVDFGVS